MVKPEQQNKRPGRQATMKQQPQSDNAHQQGSGKLAGKVALITGGDSGIGRAIAIAFAKEGADIAINYLEEHTDAKETQEKVESYAVHCSLYPGDIGNEAFCKEMVVKVVESCGALDILVNNAGEQHPQKDMREISSQQLERTFRTNIFSMFYLCQAAQPHLKDGGTIINTTSVTAYKGHPILLDYSASKGAIVAFTRSLALSVAKDNIRVNAVAPGPIWTPLIPSTFSKKQVAEFGKDTPLGRPGQPEEVAPAFVFLASDEASYITGQALHVNGGQIVNS
jgi:NAD(P)-dependent dehydrogenase (short-subunit alcohol dehydrogenase family)